MTHPVALSLRLYRRLARAFPAEFKNAYGDELLQIAEDAVEGVWQRHGSAGLARLLADIALRVAAEHLADLWRDIRYCLRTLACSPGFTAVALTSLTLGITVATSAFMEFNGWLLRDVPGVRKPGELVSLKGLTSFPNYRRYRERSDLFAATMAYRAPVPFGVGLGNRGERTWGHLVTASYFPALGVTPSLGRTFQSEDEQSGRPPAVVVSHRFWLNRLGADRSVVGKTLWVNGQLCTIIGVGPKGFQGASPMVYGADLWLPLSVSPSLAPELANNTLERHDRPVFQVVARLRPGVDAPRAEAAMDAIARQMERENADPQMSRGGQRVSLLPGGKLVPIPKEDLPVFASFFAVLGGLILLIAGSNVANMTLARATDRNGEIALRLALGAGRGRLVRLLLTESMLIACAAGLLGFVLAAWVMQLAERVPYPSPMPLAFDYAPDLQVLFFVAGLTCFTGLVLAVTPALRANETNLAIDLKGCGNARLGRWKRLRARRVLIAGQVAVSLALLLITGFLVLSHRRLMGTNVGFDPSNLYVISLDPLRDGYSGKETAAFFRRLLDQVKDLPSVTSAGLTNSIPMSMIGKPGAAYSVLSSDRSKRLRWARRASVSRDYFATVGIPIVRGRAFRAEDETDHSMAAIVSERLARECWPGADPLGQRFEIGDDELPRFDLPGRSGGGPTPVTGRVEIFQVVGVARNVRDGVNVTPADAPPVIYLPLRPDDYTQPALLGITLMIRAGPGVDAIRSIRGKIAAIDDRLTIFGARSMPRQIDELLLPVSVALWTYSFIGVFGLILASVGLAGLTAYAVARRRREIGIRVALGACERDVLSLVMKEGAALVVLGATIGLALAWAAMGTLGAVLSSIARTTGTDPFDARLLIGAPLLLAALALLACYLPARKSLRVDPVVALRQE